MMLRDRPGTLLNLHGDPRQQYLLHLGLVEAVEVEQVVEYLLEDSVVFQALLLRMRSLLVALDKVATP